jgi:chaperonin cofactor prefoldin
MRLYHSSGNNYIDCHTGSLYIRTNANTDVGGDIHLRPRSSENGVIVRDDAEVELYYNNALKMETTSSGITVLGNVDSNGNVGNLNTTDDIGQQMEYGNTDVATLRCDANRWRVYFGGGGQSREAFTVEEGGEVGIGDSTPSYKLDVAGTIRATGDVIAYSDERVKENIKTIDNSLEKVNKLRGVEFNKIGEDKKSIGVIAQEIEKVLPEVVKTDDEGMKSVAYGNVVGVLIEAVKELNKEVEELKTKLNNGN